MALAAIVGKLEERGRKPLTPREEEVMAVLLLGASIGAIAAALGVAAKTVRTHIDNVHHKLRVSTNAEACVTLALQTLLAGCPRAAPTSCSCACSRPPPRPPPQWPRTPASG